MIPRTIEWIGNLEGCVQLIDQTLLPGRLELVQISDLKSLFEAIRCLKVRGAPAIGIAGAMGLVLALRDAQTQDREEFLKLLDTQADYLACARPTAVNLTWALERLRNVAHRQTGLSVADLKRMLLAEAKAIRDEDAATCRTIGQNGLALIKPGARILTHCNAGSLATAEYGTALAPLYLAHEKGIDFTVYVDETRPLLQGSRLTAWELGRAGIEVTVICDSVAGHLMSLGRIDLVITGADRIAANGDAANKIGTYSLARLARDHGIAFYIAAPASTFDLSIADGSQIPIEQRAAEEVTEGFGRRTAPADVKVYSPAFDVTPAEFITAIITELGVIEPVNAETIARVMR
ncbi:MAG: S-methyl-5-thioribose-1-phosphate isomerase [Phycisphaerae bacterium]|nr:S-methyl-5-thioribose-1-phosphate isomerase [Phycisphaerae bacterium]